MDQNNCLQPGLIIDQRFKLLKKIGSGSFGIVYLTFDLDEKEYCATKFENRNLQLRMMNREILILKQLKGINGFPELINHGKDQQYSYYMSTLLGENLEVLLKKIGGKFSLQTTLQLAIQLIDRLEGCLLYKNQTSSLKTFLFLEKTYRIFLKNRSYWNSPLCKHSYITMQEQLDCSGMEQSRRDDLESLGYMLIYFVRGEFPWSNVKAIDKDDKQDQILQVKTGIPLISLCFNLPKCFIHYFQHVKSLLFQQQPNYSHLRNLFEKQPQDYDHQLYDWEIKQMEMQTQDILIDPHSIPNIRLQSEKDFVPPVDEEREVFHLEQENQHNVKFMKQLHEKYFDHSTYKQQDELQLQKNTSIEPQSQATSKQNNYQISNHTLIQVKSQPQINNNPNQFTKRKDSKSYTSFKQSQEHKENRKFRQSNDDYDLDMANDDGPNLDLKNLEVTYFLK